MQHRAQRQQPVAHLLLGNAKHLLLSRVEHEVDVFVGPHCQGTDGCTSLQEAPAGSRLIDDVGVIADVGGRRHPIEQLGEVLDTTNAVELSAAAHGVGDRDGVDRLVRIEETKHGLENDLMRRLVEVIGAKSLKRNIGGVARQHHRSEH